MASAPRLFWSLLVLVAAAPAGIGAPASDPCVPSTEIRAAIDGLPVRSILETTWEYQQKRLQAIQDLVRRFPDDIFVQHQYVNFARQSDWEKAAAEYKAHYEQKPNDPRLTYLYGLTLVGRRSPEAIKLLERALAEAPQNPWPHRPLANIYNSPVFQDKGRAVMHVKALVDACPAAVEVYQQLTTVDDQKLLVSSAARLRSLIEKSSDAEAVRGYQILWQLEFKTHSTSEYAAVRKQVSLDLERIRSLRLEDKQQWYATLQNGYKLVNDQKQADWASDEQDRRFPSPSYSNAIAAWRKDHPYPKVDDPLVKKREFYAALLTEANRWLKERPNGIYARSCRLDAMAHLEDTPAAALESAADEYFQFAERDAGPQGASPYTYFEICRALSNRHLKPDRVVELAKKGLARWETVDPLPDLQATKENVAARTFYRSISWLLGTGFAATGYLDLKQPDKARPELDRMDERLESLKKLASTKEEYKAEYGGQIASWWGLVARSAEMQDRPLDAMAFYTNALLARLNAQQKPETGLKDDLAENARRLWTKLGGTAEGWMAWYGRRADALARQNVLTWEEANQPFPAFELPDITGKVWNSASLKGKVTFLNFWASW